MILVDLLFDLVMCSRERSGSCIINKLATSLLVKPLWSHCEDKCGSFQILY